MHIFDYTGLHRLVLCNRFADKQIVRVQETPDEIPEGGTPHTVSLLMHDKLVDAGKPGDRVEVSFNNNLKGYPIMRDGFLVTMLVCFTSCLF